ncbi:MAG TPA: hypothetical protein V6C97_32890 [Oculatellaceae cyanobacterium]
MSLALSRGQSSNLTWRSQKRTNWLGKTARPTRPILTVGLKGMAYSKCPLGWKGMFEKTSTSAAVELRSNTLCRYAGIGRCAGEISYAKAITEIPATVREFTVGS